MALHAAAGLLFAVLASDALGWDRTGDTANARGPVALCAPLVAVILGLVAVRAKTRAFGTAFLLQAGAVLFSSIPPAWMVDAFWSWPARLGSSGQIYAASLSMSAMLFVLTRALTWIDGRADRARPETPIRTIDERAGWSALATLGAVGGSMVVALRHDKSFLDLYGSLSAALACVAMAAWLFARDAAATRGLHRAIRDGGTLESQTEAPEGSHVIDLGLGDGFHVRAARSGNYRSAPGNVMETLRGSPKATLSAARRSARLAGVGLFAGVVSVALAVLIRGGAG